jgi:hypothetical protein
MPPFFGSGVDGLGSLRLHRPDVLRRSPFAASVVNTERTEKIAESASVCPTDALNPPHLRNAQGVEIFHCSQGLQLTDLHAVDVTYARWLMRVRPED